MGVELLVAPLPVPVLVWVLVVLPLAWAGTAACRPAEGSWGRYAALDEGLRSREAAPQEEEEEEEDEKQEARQLLGLVRPAEAGPRGW